MKDIVIERIQDYKRDLEKLKDSKLDKVINECDKVLEIFTKNIDDYSIDEEFESLLILACRLERIKNEVNKLDDVVSRLSEGLEIFLKIYD